jgi:ribosomal protein S18 acetylase RimI-like enzyme
MSISGKITHQPKASKSLFEELSNLDQSEMKYSWNFEEWKNYYHAIESGVLIFNPDNSQDIIGAILYKANRHDDVVHLLKIMVNSDYRRRGIAQSLLSRLKQLAVSSDKRSIYLEVEKTNLGAIKFYKQQGFQMLREVKGYYSDGADAITMELQVT